MPFGINAPEKEVMLMTNKVITYLKESALCAYWSQGKSLCIFFGPTPQSSSKKPIPASPVVIVGKTNTDSDVLRSVQLGEEITVSVVEE